MTKQDQYIAALIAYGFVRSDLQPRLGGTRPYSRKYVRMHKGTQVFWIGKAGPVRQGATVTASHAMSDSWKAKLIEGKLVAHGTRRIPPNTVAVTEEA